VTTGAEPHGLGGAEGESGRGGGRDERAERARARVRRRRRLGERGADQGVDAVRADQHVGFGLLPVGEAQAHARLGHREAVQPLDCVRGDRPLDRVKQVGAVHRVGVLAEMPGRLGGEVLRGQHRAVLPPAELPADVQLNRPLAERAEHAEPPEHAGRVGRDHDARAGRQRHRPRGRGLSRDWRP
jgi:hypothetical protein